MREVQPGDTRAVERIAVLYQALPPPVIDGVRKDPKPGGYSDSGADIGFCLRGRGWTVLTPVATPDPAAAHDWVFPDTQEGIARALAMGATLLWANTVLFAGHPLEAAIHRCRIVGQLPSAMQAADDKFVTNKRLEQAGLPVAASVLAAPGAKPGVLALADLSEQTLASHGLAFPLIVKPVRGRGSQGVTWVDRPAALAAAAAGLVASGRFGDELIVEQYLGGDELTVTVFADKAGPAGEIGCRALPPVLRFNHVHGVAPYNGAVAVTRNSRVLSDAEQQAPKVAALLDHCLAAARLVGARAPIRIDCRADARGAFRLFDLNMKPNLTGAGRPGRDDQDGLTAIAARGIGWSYGVLLEAMIAAAWRAA
jgi:D-alanine-D-alanine ligase